MGISSSTNTVNSMIKNVNDVFNTYENICSASGNEVDTTFKLNGCSLTGDIFRLNNYQAVSQSCIQNATTTTAIRSDVEQAMRQAATAVTQSIGFPSFTQANAFIQQSIDAGNDITNQYINTCVGNALKSNLSFSCQNSNISNSVVEINSFQSLTQSCVSNYITTSDIVSKLVSSLDQSTSASQENTFGYFMLVFVLFIGIIAWAGISIASEPAVQWLIVGLVLFSIVGSVIYTVFAKQFGLYPYSKAS